MQVSQPFKRIILLQLVITAVLSVVSLYRVLLQTACRTGILLPKVIDHTGYDGALHLQALVNFILPFLFFAVTLGHCIISFYTRQEPRKSIMRLSFTGMTLGMVLLVIQAFSVSYFFPLFLTGIILLIAGSWLPVISWLRLYRQWKKVNNHTPLAIHGIFISFATWIIAGCMPLYMLTVSLRSSPAGLNIFNSTLLSTLSYYSSHTLLFFVLGPVFLAILVLLPVIAGGRLYTAEGGRIIFISLLVLAVPLFMLVHPSAKPVITFLSIIIPGLVLLFVTTASLEYAGKKNGSGKGLFSWIERLPYFDETKYLFAYLVSAFFLFSAGICFSIIRFPYQHNTSQLNVIMQWLTGGAAFLVIAGCSLYLYTKLSGKKITWPRLTVTIPYLWIMGMVLYALGLNWGSGTDNLQLTGINDGLSATDRVQSSTLIVLGGIVLLIAGTLFLAIFLGTLFSTASEKSVLTIPVSISDNPEKPIPLLLRYKPWLMIVAVLTLAVCIPPLISRTKKEQVILIAADYDKKNTHFILYPDLAPPLSIKKDYGLLLGFLASIGVFILILLFCVQASGLQRKLRSQKSSFPG